MQKDIENKYRPLFAGRFNDFPDRVDNPWERAIPDLPEFNRKAYEQISRQLAVLQRDEQHKSRGVLILGEAGTGKTHLLMRVAQKLSTVHAGKDSLKSHILFVRRPNNEEAVTQHIWDNIVISLNQSLNEDQGRSQLDTMLAHVFSAVLIPEFEQDIAEGKDADQKKRWKSKLEADPYTLFALLGEGEQRKKNLNYIRRKTLNHLKTHQSEVDQLIANVLITYCLVGDKNRKRLLLEWLRGKEIDEERAKELGLPKSTWVYSDETSGDAAVQQEREKYALKAIQTIGILSTYYRPLILAFDQLEGLRDKELLTRNWGDTVREIFTMTPNLLILTCIFPNLWESWFSTTLDTSILERNAQMRVDLEPFSCEYGMKFLEMYMKPLYQEFRLPSPIYPFTPEDVESICVNAASPRQFLQRVNEKLQEWFWPDSETITDPADGLLDREAINLFISKRLAGFNDNQMKDWSQNIPIENDYFGRIRTVLETLIEHCPSIRHRPKATCEKRVMPLNVVLSDAENSVCFGVLNSMAVSFTSRMKNLMSVLDQGDQFTRSVIFRDRRCTGLGKKSHEYIDEFTTNGGFFRELDQEETAFVNAVYDTLIAIEEYDMTLDSHQVDKREFVDYLLSTGELDNHEFFRTTFDLLPSLKTMVVSPPPAAPPVPDTSEPVPTEVDAVDDAVDEESASEFVFSSESERIETETFSESFDVLYSDEESDDDEPSTPYTADIVVGNKNLDIAQSGLLGKLKDSQKKVAFSFSKPMCAMVVGYMGSGKSYALGVLMENALLNVENLTWNPRPTSVVAFNYRRNAESRFEYGSYTQPNGKIEEVKRLIGEYEAMPKGIEKINVLGFGPELLRRNREYGNATLYPIQFLPHELSAEHWEILMKPPTTNAEYMNIARDIIQKLFYDNRLTFANLQRAVEDDERLTPAQRQRVNNRLSFAKTWISDRRDYEWSDIFSAGALSVFDLRMQALTKEDALRLCLIITDIVRKTSNGVNKTIVFDEAHEYVDSKDLVDELENAITQIRHDGLSFILASQFPERIPQNILKYLLTRMIFKIPDQRAINYLRGAAPNLSNLSPYQVSNLNTEAGECFLQSDDDCSDTLLRKPQPFIVRPRCSQHGGATKRS